MRFLCVLPWLFFVFTSRKHSPELTYALIRSFCRLACPVSWQQYIALSGVSKYNKVRCVRRLFPVCSNRLGLRQRLQPGCGLIVQMVRWATLYHSYNQHHSRRDTQQVRQSHRRPLQRNDGAHSVHQRHLQSVKWQPYEPILCIYFWPQWLFKREQSRACLSYVECSQSSHFLVCKGTAIISATQLQRLRQHLYLDKKVKTFSPLVFNKP